MDELDHDYLQDQDHLLDDDYLDLDWGNSVLFHVEFDLPFLFHDDYPVLYLNVLEKSLLSFL